MKTQDGLRIGLLGGGDINHSMAEGVGHLRASNIGDDVERVHNTQLVSHVEVELNASTVDSIDSIWSDYERNAGEGT